MQFHRLIVSNFLFRLTFRNWRES